MEKLSIRKAEDLDMQKEGLKAIEKSDVNELDFGVEGTKKKGSKKSGRNVEIFTDVNFGFAGPQPGQTERRDDRSRGGRGGGRGGGREGGGRGGGRGGDRGRGGGGRGGGGRGGGGRGGDKAVVKMEDANEFPAL